MLSLKSEQQFLRECFDRCYNLWTLRDLTTRVCTELGIKFPGGITYVGQCIYVQEPIGANLYIENDDKFHFTTILQLLNYQYLTFDLTLLFISSSFVFISHLTNFLSYSMSMYVACFFCLTLPLKRT